jgi:hypothetical protein
MAAQDGAPIPQGHWDRFDIAEAYWVYMAEWHGGGGSIEYALSTTFARMRFRPRHDLSSDTLEENGQDILQNLVSGARELRDRRPQNNARYGATRREYRKSLGLAEACS